jgi:hypothetical protein
MQSFRREGGYSGWILFSPPCHLLMGRLQRGACAHTAQEEDRMNSTTVSIAALRNRFQRQYPDRDSTYTVARGEGPSGSRTRCGQRAASVPKTTPQALQAATALFRLKRLANPTAQPIDHRRSANPSRRGQRKAHAGGVVFRA